MMWFVVLAGAIGCYLIKLLGYVIPQEWLSGERFTKVNTLLPIALLSSLVVVLTVSVETGPVIDARLAGVAGTLGKRAPTTSISRKPSLKRSKAPQSAP